MPPKPFTRKARKYAPARVHIRGVPKKGKLLPTVIKKQIKAVIDANLEDKQGYKSTTDVNYNSGIDSVADVNFIVPNISQGTNDASRVGDQMTAKKLNIKGHMIVNMSTIDYNSSRIAVRMMVVQPKSYIGQPSISASATTWLGYLLKKGATEVGFTGLTSDLYAPINTDSITKYYDRIFYLEAPLIPGTNTGIVNTRHMTKFFSISLKVKNKKLLYDQNNNSGLTPTNYNPVLILGYAHLDSATPDTVSTQVNLSWISTLDYQDA